MLEKDQINTDIVMSHEDDCTCKHCTAYYYHYMTEIDEYFLDKLDRTIYAS